MRGNQTVVDILLKLQRGAGIQLNEGGNALHLAVLTYQNHILKSLLASDFVTREHCQQENKDKLTPLSFAATIGNIMAIHILCASNKVDKLYRNQEGRNALHFAAIKCQRKAVKHLLKENLDTRIADTNDDTPITLAQKRQQVCESSFNVAEKNLVDEYKLICNILSNFGKEHQVIEFQRKALSRIKIKNLVFQGGGPKGVAYIGAIRALERYDRIKELKRVGGTSAGAITAVLLALNFNSTDLEKALDEKSFLDFADNINLPRLTAERKNSLIKGIVSFWEALKAAYHNRDPQTKSRWDYLHPLRQLMKLEGLTDGTDFLNWIEGLIKSKLINDGIEKKYGRDYVDHLTFGQLHKLVLESNKGYKELYMIATCVTGGHQIAIMNSEDDKWSDVIISDAVRASMAIPGFFTPHQLRIKRQGQIIRLPSEEYLDGGILKNYPIDIFDKLKFVHPLHQTGDPEFPIFNEETYGFSLFTPESEVVNLSEALQQTSSTTELGKAIMNVYLLAEQLLSELSKATEYRTIKISNQNVGLLEFNLLPEKKIALIQGGEKAVITSLQLPENEASPFTEESSRLLVFSKLSIRDAATSYDDTESTKKIDEEIKQLMERPYYKASYIREQLQLYITPCSCDPDASPYEISSMGEKLPPLKDKIKDFFSSNARILLLKGESGSGKTLFGCYLEKSYWDKFNEDHNGPIIIFISLPKIKDPINNLINEFFEKKFDSNADKIINNLKNRYQVYFILDAYDEIPQFQADPSSVKNLYVTNDLYDWDKAKFIISCRNSFLNRISDLTTERSYEKYFVPVYGDKLEYNLFEVAQIAFFDKNQVNQYIDEYVNSSFAKIAGYKSAAEYKDKMKSLPNVKDLVKSPLLLKMTIQALPIIVAWHSAKKQDSENAFTKFTERDIFLAYIKDNLNRQEARLLEEKGVRNVPGNIKTKFLEFLINLSMQMKKEKMTTIHYNFQA